MAHVCLPAWMFASICLCLRKVDIFLVGGSRSLPLTDTLQPRQLDYAAILTIPAPKVYQQYPDFQLYPICTYPIAPLYNLNGVTNLVLSMPILEKIWSGRIRTW
eukprot:EG_transcript_56411